MNSNTVAIVLYGSYARRDNDNNSDCDMCVFVRNGKRWDGDNSVVIDFIGGAVKSINCDVYSVSMLDSMLKHGSLFLWHLKTEGIILYGGEFLKKKFSNLKEFCNCEGELLYYRNILLDLERAQKYIFLPNELDLSILFTIVRNVSMVLAYKMGRPSFGRLNSYNSAKSFFPDLPITKLDYEFLSNCKLLYERDCKISIGMPSAEKYMRIVDRVKELLDYAANKIS